MPETTLVISGKEYLFDPEDLELREVELIENELGSALDDIDWRRASALRCLAFVVLSRENPDITMEDVGRLKTSDFADNAPKANGKSAPPTKRPRGARSSG